MGQTITLEREAGACYTSPETVDRKVANLLTYVHSIEPGAIDLLLEQQDPYIRKLAFEMLHFDPRFDELVQLSRIKLWQAAKARVILNHKAYIRCIVRSAYIELMRQKKNEDQLLVNEDGELVRGHILCGSSEGLRDPLVVLESREDLLERLNMLLDIAITLPPKQRKAFLCQLKERIDDPALLVEICRARNLDIESEELSGDQIEKHKQAASYTWAKKRARKLMQRQAASCS